MYLGVGTTQPSGNVAAAAVPSSVSGAGLTWTLVHDEVSTLTGVHESVYRAYASSPSPGAVTIAFAGTKALCAWSIVEVDGANIGGTNGANSVVQADGAQNDTGSATDAPVTLASFADAGNGGLAFAFHVGVGSTPTATPDTGWTELNESTNFEVAGYGIQASWRADNDTTVATSWSVGGYSRGIALEIAAVAATLTQSRSQWRNDDGSETTATWAAAENANITAAVAQALRLRVQVQGTGDPASAAYTLRYQKNGSGGYVAVPVGASVTPTLSYGAAGAFAYSATNPAPSYPAGITADSELVLIVGQKPSSANGGTVTTPTGWTLQASLTGSNDGNTGGYTTTLGADTGNCNIYVYTKDSVSGSESGTLTVTTGTNNVAWASIVRLQKSVPGTVSWAAATGKDTSAGSVSIATGALDLAAGDYLIGGMVIPTDVTTPSQFSAHALSQSGTTFGTVTEIGEADSSTGNDIGGYLIQAPVSSGSGTGAVTMTATAGGTTTNVRGPGFLLRARPVAVANEVYLATSSNITDGEATTAQLTAGSGTFDPGKMVDASNSITLNLGDDRHTELEFSLATQAPAANGDYFDFRVYAGGSPLDTYTVTLRWTIGGGVTTVSVTGVSATGQVGTVVGKTGAVAAPTGVAGTGQVGTLIAKILAQVALTGVSASGQVGAVTVTGAALAAPTGVAGSGSVGTVSAGVIAQVSVTGVSASGQSGTVTAKTGAKGTPTGVSATGSVGTVAVTAGVVVTLSGVQASGSPGSVTVLSGSVIPVTGVQGTGQAGSVSVSAAGSQTVPVTGVAATGTAGTMLAKSGSVATPTGVQAAGAAGAMSTRLGSLVAIVGVSGTGQVGSVAAGGGLIVPVAGVAAAAAVGNIAAITGVSVLVPGVTALGAAGVLEIAAGVTVQLTGVEADGLVGAVLALVGTLSAPASRTIFVEVGTRTVEVRVDSRVILVEGRARTIH